MSENKVFAVIGLGVFGKKVAEVLAEKGANVMVLDNNADRIERMKNVVASAVLLDATDEAALMKAPLDDVDVAVVAIGDDIEASILATALMKRRGIPYIIGRAVSEIHETILRQVGANEVVNPEVLEGNRVAQRLFAPGLSETIPLSQDYGLAETSVPKSFVGKTIEAAKLRERFNLNIISIRRLTLGMDQEGNLTRKEELVFPRAGEVLQKSDVLFLMGRKVDLEGLGGLD